MELHLSDEEKELLVEILRQYQRDLLLEISHAAHHEFKVGLREREGRLEALLARLQTAERAA